jgi:hypothetical protein
VRELGREEMHVNVGGGGGGGDEEMAMDGHRAPILKLDRKRRGIYRPISGRIAETLPT